MATGDSDNIFQRLKSVLPPGWFKPLAPLRDVVLGGLADDLARIYGLLLAVKASKRVATATNWILDLTVWDFFGPDFLRRTAEADDAFRPRFIAEIFRERVTKAGIAKALFDLTGRQPKLFEMFSPADCGGGYGLGQIAYGAAGAYGSLDFPNQIFVTAYRPAAASIPLIAGYGAGPAGYGSLGSSAAYATITDVIAPVSDADIYDTVAATAAAGVIAWVDIRS